MRILSVFRAHRLSEIAPSGLLAGTIVGMAKLPFFNYECAMAYK
jgi:hypothetical protein